MFWIGLLAGAAIAMAVNWLVRKGILTKWYEWLLAGLGILALFATGQHYFSSLRENEPQSAWMGALIFGIIALILLGVAWQLSVRRANKT